MAPDGVQMELSSTMLWQSLSETRIYHTQNLRKNCDKKIWQEM
jgi:hypothetical protein